jgi:hypothetical protein
MHLPHSPFRIPLESRKAVPSNKGSTGFGCPSWGNASQLRDRSKNAYDRCGRQSRFKSTSSPWPHSGVLREQFQRGCLEATVPSTSGSGVPIERAKLGHDRSSFSAQALFLLHDLRFRSYVIEKSIHCIPERQCASPS